MSPYRGRPTRRPPMPLGTSIVATQGVTARVLRLIVVGALAATGCGGPGGPLASPGGPASPAAMLPSPTAPTTTSTTTAASATSGPGATAGIPAAPSLPTRLSASQASFRLPTRISRTVVFALGDTLVVCGGLVPAGTSGTILRIDLPSGTPTTIGRLAVPVHDAAGALLGGAWLVLGGGELTQETAIQRVRLAGVAARIGNLPAARADLVAAGVGDAVVVAGGVVSGVADAHVVATTDGAAFRTIATLPVAVRYPAAAVLGGRLYLFGGASDAGDVADIQVIDPAAGTAARAGRLPATLSHATAFVLDGRIFIAGGRRAGQPLADILSFDPATGAVTAAGTLPQPVSDAAVALVGSAAWLLGGERSATVDDVVILAPARIVAP